MRVFVIGLALVCAFARPGMAQTPPGAAEVSAYNGLFAAAFNGDAAVVRALLTKGADLERRDGAGRTALHVAAYQSHDDIVRLLARNGADMNALEDQAYDIVTIASVANDAGLLKVALENGASARNVTSPYDGTALIAAAHLGHHEVVRILIRNGAPLDHVNNLGWTAVLEAVILGDGGTRHQLTLKSLLEAGADASIPDRNGVSPLEHARKRGHQEMAALIEGR